MNGNEIRFSQPTRTEPAPSGESRKPSSTLKKTLKIVGIIVILAVIGLVLFLSRNVFSKIFSSAPSEVYSAVFLTNGQVYFGKMKENTRTEIVLTGVFYLQVSGDATAEAQLNKPKFSLIKLGQELHGPTDELFINRSQVVFYENLRDDSEMVEAIKNYKR